ncbi:hypothetical protein BCR36DRAFT_179469 [Piromyces finnis]|uniref:RGS domain-containing protein n=1 Tax=Piromyces finnis TaxID=1754191 RepID=A0A1Y1UVN5_9FUNG|nr:hypothetical protein BCR36DRAFT_179469 [Piromyces finnis]|eukprot:ORX41670.1 hypothetical protein BCR36DRAFT_179469 [Piromyces finnis]
MAPFKDEQVEKYTDYYFIIYIPLLLVSLLYIITSLILFILSAFTEDSDTPSEHKKFKIPSIIYIIICLYAIPLWMFTSIIRVKKMEFRFKIQNARLNNSIRGESVLIENDKLHINVIQFKFFEKWSNIAVIGLIGVITVIVLIMHTFKNGVLYKNKYVSEKCHTAILITIFISMFYALYKKYKLRNYKETIGIQNEIYSIIIISLLCSLGYIVFRFLSIRFKGVPVSIWFVLFFILYHTIIVVRPVFAVHIYQNKVELLHEKYRRHSIAKVKINDEVNEMEIKTFEQVLNPKNSIYKEFKRFLVGEVCIENLLFYEAMINILLKCQNKIISSSSNNNASWNLKKLAENPNYDDQNSLLNTQSNDSMDMSEIPYYERLYETAIINESQEIKNHLINIFEKFVPEGSEYQLNLTSDLVKSVEQKINENDQVNIILFKPVLKEVYELLRWTNYPRFLQTRTSN